MPRSKSGKTQKVDPVAMGQAVKDIINNNKILRMAAFNFGISKTNLSCYLLQFQEQEPPSPLQFQEILIASHEFELVEYFKQAATFLYAVTKKEAFLAV